MRILLLLLSFFLVSNLVYAEDELSSESEVEYIEMKPKFTVNLDTPKHYMLIKVQLMVEGGGHIDKIKKHLPALRHELIMLYSGRSANDLETMEQREALRQESIKTVSKALDNISNSDGFRDLFFTEFLVH